MKSIKHFGAELISSFDFMLISPTFTSAYKTHSHSLLKLVTGALVVERLNKDGFFVGQYWCSNVKCAMFLDPDRSVNEKMIVWLLACSYFSKIRYYSAVDLLNQSVENNGVIEIKLCVLN